MPPATDMTPPQVAVMLACTPPTVRALIDDGLLPATATKKGKRTFHTVNSDDVDTYIAQHGTFASRSGRRTRPESNGSTRTGRDEDPDEPGGSSVLQEIRDLRDLVESRVGSADAHADVVALQEALQLQRAAMAVLLEADDARSEGIELLKQAMDSFQSADTKRKRAAELLDDCLLYTSDAADE